MLPEPASSTPVPVSPPTAPTPGVKPIKAPVPVSEPLLPPPTPPAAPTAPTASAAETTISSAENIPAIADQASPAPPAPLPKPPAAEQAPSTTLSYVKSPAPAQEKETSAASPPAEPTPPPAAEPASPEKIAAQHQELHETVVALELNIEVAVREVLRIFGQQPLSLDEIVQHLTAVRWDFGELHPRVATGEALKHLVEKGGAKEEDGKYVFSRA